MTTKEVIRQLGSLEDVGEPSITSSDPNERKLARRLRIQRRLETATKQARVEIEGVVERTHTEKQIHTSAEALEKFQLEGDEVVSSVKVANDAREVQRREQENEIREKLLKKLEESDKDCMREYEEINKKWPDLLASNDPLEIHAELEAQNEKCLDILAKKDAVIAELRKELELADSNFVQDQKKQNEDINLLIERIENQTTAIAKAYRAEMELIDNAIDAERKVLLEESTEKWEATYKKICDDDKEGIEKRKEIMKQYEEEMQRVIIEHQEEFRALKIKLETECEKLQQEVENMKVTCLMNTEKLDYNYAVLKSREDENAIIKNQQKRRINRLQDAISKLKKAYAETDKKTKEEIRSLTDQVLKLHKNIHELLEKSDNFTKMNETQYLQIWDMNINTANELVEKILTADRIIHEQTLGIDWEPPEKPILQKEDLPSYREVVAKIEEQKKQAEDNKKVVEPYKPADTLDELNLERRMLNHIVKQISDRSGYLIEDSLREILLPYTINDNLVIRLDNVFQALGIQTEEEVCFLLHFFIPFTYCPTCKDESTDTVISEVLCIASEPSSEVVSSNDISSDVCGKEELDEKTTNLIALVNKEACADKLCIIPNVCPDVSAHSVSTPHSTTATPETLCDSTPETLCDSAPETLSGSTPELDNRSGSLRSSDYVEGDVCRECLYSEDLSKEDVCQEDMYMEDVCKDDEYKEDVCKEDEYKEDVCKEDVCKEDVCMEDVCGVGMHKEDVCKEDVYEEDVCKADVSTEDVFTEEICKQGESKEDTSEEYVSKEDVLKSASSVVEEKRPQLLCDNGHLLAIETVNVTKALKEFVERFRFVKSGEVPPSFKERLSMNKLTVSRNLTEEDIKLFWQRYRDIFSEDKERLWDALLIGLKKYYEVLKERHQLNLETESLRKQNSELRRLLKSYATQPEKNQDDGTEFGTLTSMT